MAIAPISRADVGRRDLQGEFVRKLAKSLTGPPTNGPTYKAASFTVPAYQAGSPTPDGGDCDGWYALDGTAAQVIATLPVAANTPLATRIKFTQVNEATNGMKIQTADTVVFGNGATSRTYNTQGLTHAFTLANVNGVYQWLEE